METSLTTQDENQLLALARSQVGGGQRLPHIPQIKMVNDKSEVQGMEKGEYYISQSVKDDSGEYKTENKSIGKNPVVTILIRLYSYSRYSNAREKLVAWTNEFSGFTDFDNVYLLNNTGEKPTLETQLPYPAFKKYIREKYWDEAEERSTLKFRNILYVLFEGKVYRMFVSSASVVGENEDGTRGEYKNPTPLSFAHFDNTLKAGPQAYFERLCKLGSKANQEKGYYLMTFEDAGPVEDRSAMIQMWHRLSKELEQRFAIEFAPYMQQSSPPDFKEVTPDDLPSFA